MFGRYGRDVAEPLYDVLTAGKHRRIGESGAIEIRRTARNAAEVDAGIAVGDDVRPADIVGPDGVARRQVDAARRDSDRDSAERNV